MKIQCYCFEGTAEELEKAKHLFPHIFHAPSLSNTAVDQAFSVTPVSAPIPAPLQGNGKLTEKAVSNFFERRPLNDRQKAVIKAIRDAGDQGITSSEIAKSVKLESADVKTVMRSFGKRIAHTDDWPSKVSAFNQTWEESENRYRLHQQMRAVIESGQVRL